MSDDEQRQLDEFRQTIDVTTFNNAPYSRRIEKPWGWELHWAPDNLPYMGKLIHVNAGKRLSLQVHDKKQESWLKLSGDAYVVIEDSSGNMVEVKLEDGKGYTAALGQKHRLKAGETDAEFIEVSTPEIGTTFRLEDDYNRSSETEAAREERNQQAA